MTTYCLAKGAHFVLKHTVPQMSWGHNLSPRYNKYVAGMVSYRDLAKPAGRIGVSGALLIATPAFFWYLGEATTKEVPIRSPYAEQSSSLSSPQGLKADKFPLHPYVFLSPCSSLWPRLCPHLRDLCNGLQRFLAAPAKRVERVVRQRAHGQGQDTAGAQGRRQRVVMDAVGMLSANCVALL